MLTRLRARLSYANVVSTLALFLTLGGSAYATGLIDGKTLKDRSVRAKKVARNTLGGTEIKESKLGKVPKAGQADLAKSAAAATTATSAGNAETLGGLAPGAFVQGSGHAITATRALDSASSADVIITLPGVGVLKGGCSGASPSLQFENQSGEEMRAVGTMARGTGVQESPAAGIYASGATVGLAIGSPNATGIAHFGTTSGTAVTVIYSLAGCARATATALTSK
jgi:hypothetical protein